MKVIFRLFVKIRRSASPNCVQITKKRSFLHQQFSTKEFKTSIWIVKNKKGTQFNWPIIYSTGLWNKASTSTKFLSFVFFLHIIKVVRHLQIAKTLEYCWSFLFQKVWSSNFELLNVILNSFFGQLPLVLGCQLVCEFLSLVEKMCCFWILLDRFVDFLVANP